MTLRTNGTRPGQRWLALVVGLLALMLGAAALALALISDTGTHDVIVADSGSSKTADLGNASVEYIGSSASNQSSGTGIFDPFVRLQGSPTEAGYNTDGTVEFATKTGKWTKAILASAIPVVDCGGDLAGTDCWELFVDINENNTAKYVSLNEVEVWLTDDPELSGYPTNFNSDATQVYDFHGAILIHDVNQGSGRGDLRYLIPVQEFESGDFFVLYSEWGTSGGTFGDTAPDGKTWGSEGGFEEWKVRKAPNVTIVKTADAASVNAGQNIGFRITITNNGAADATGVTITDELPGGPGIDWSEDSASCSISGSPAAPPEILTCGPVTLAAGGGSLQVHVTSATTAASCGEYDNLATFTSTNAGTGSDDASVTVQCGALLILKESTKTGNPLVATAGAEFCYSTTTGCTTTNVTDNGTGDEDLTVGSVCVSGLTPGTYKVNETKAPPGYGDTTGSEATLTVDNGTTCTAGSLPGAGATATFTNPPLADLLVQVDGQSSGEISSSISCVDSGGTVIGSIGTDPPDDPLVDPAEVDVDNLDPDTYTCTIVIDP